MKRGGRTGAAALAGKLARGALRAIRPGSGTSLPGLIALKIDPDFLANQAARFPRRVLVTGTNGKTSTVHLIRHFLEGAGHKVVSNAEGANLSSGLATTLLEGAPGATLLLETDELTLASGAELLEPQLIIVTGLFRDQLDRFGEVTALHRRLAEALGRFPGQLLLNADDPLAASLAREGDAFFSVSGIALLVPGDLPGCPRCGAALSYQEHYYAHLGRYQCPRCGFQNPEAHFRAHIAAGELVFQGGLARTMPPYLHPYSAAAALSASAMLGVQPGPTWPQPAWGRGETYLLGGRQVTLTLAKNPASLSWNLAQPGADAHLFLINDGAADGRDVSWLWDAHYGEQLEKVVVAGNRRFEMMIRLRYLDPTPSARCFPDLAGATGALIRELGEGQRGLILSTYTNLQAERQLLRAGPSPRSAREVQAAGLPKTTYSPSPPPRRLKILQLYPEQMGTYGDNGNLIVLRRRLEWRGLGAEVWKLGPGDSWPGSPDLLLMGGGEDLAQELILDSMRRLRENLRSAIEDGVPGLLICGALQQFGERLTVSGRELAGLDLLPLETRPGSGRLVGRLSVSSEQIGEVLVGFENHGGRTTRSGGEPLGKVLHGHGNREGGGEEGIRYRQVLGTYLHGPVLARNPWMADHLLQLAAERQGWRLPPLEADDDLERQARTLLLQETASAPPPRRDSEAHTLKRSRSAGR